MSRVRDTVKNTLLVFSSRGLNGLLRLFTVILVARYISVEEFGNYTFVLALMSVTVVIADFINFQIVTRDLSRDRDKARNIMGSVIMLRLFFSVMVLVLTFIVIQFMNIDAFTRTAIYIVTISQLILAFNTIFVAVFSAHNRFGYEAMMQIVSRGMEILLIGVVIFFNLGYTALFIAMGSANLLVGLFGGAVYLVNFGIPKFNIDLKICKYYFWESFPIALTTLFTIAGFRVDVFILKALKGYEDITFFNVPQTIIFTLQILPQSFLFVIFPTLCRYGKGSAEMRSLFIHDYKRAFKFLYIIALLLSMLLISLPKEIIQLLVGVKFLNSANALRIMGISVIFLFLNALNAIFLIAVNKQRIIIVTTMGSFLVNLILDLLLIPRYGYIGASIATTAACCVLFFLSLYYTVQNLGRLDLAQIVIKPILGALGIISFIMYFDGASPYISFPASISIYLLSLILLKAFSAEDVELLKKVVRRAS